MLAAGCEHSANCTALWSSAEIWRKIFFSLRREFKLEKKCNMGLFFGLFFELTNRFTGSRQVLLHPAQGGQKVCSEMNLQG